MKTRYPEFDAINRQRFNILTVLDGTELEASEISRSSGLRPANTFYHLNVLQENQLIEKTKTKKKCVWKRGHSKPIIRWKLTQTGQEAVLYFPKTFKGRQFL